MSEELAAIVADLVDRVEELERRQTVLEAGIALARWILASAIPVAAVLVAVWKG